MRNPGPAQTEDDGVLIVLDDQQVREASVQSAVGLAKRLHCSLSVLLLSELGSAGESHAEQLCINEICQAARAAGVEVRAASRRGDRASELLKFLGSRAPFRALIWGGEPLVLTARRYAGSRHWFSRIRAQLHCPVVSASQRDPDPEPGPAITS